MKRPQQPERFGNQKLIRTKSSTRDGAVSVDTVLRKAGPAMTKAPRSHLTSPALQVSGSRASQALSRCLGSLRNPAQSSRLHTASRGSQCTGSCPGETTCKQKRVREPEAPTHRAGGLAAANTSNWALSHQRASETRSPGQPR